MYINKNLKLYYECFMEYCIDNGVNKFLGYWYIYKDDQMIIKDWCVVSSYFLFVVVEFW